MEAPYNNLTPWQAKMQQRPATLVIVVKPTKGRLHAWQQRKTCTHTSDTNQPLLRNLWWTRSVPFSVKHTIQQRKFLCCFGTEIGHARHFGEGLGLFQPTSGFPGKTFATIHPWGQLSLHLVELMLSRVELWQVQRVKLNTSRGLALAMYSLTCAPAILQIGKAVGLFWDSG